MPALTLSGCTWDPSNSDGERIKVDLCTYIHAYIHKYMHTRMPALTLSGCTWDPSNSDGERIKVDLCTLAMMK